jgi:hypothetical protein
VSGFIAIMNTSPKPRCRWSVLLVSGALGLVLGAGTGAVLRSKASRQPMTAALAPVIQPARQPAPVEPAGGLKTAEFEDAIRRALSLVSYEQREDAFCRLAGTVPVNQIPPLVNFLAKPAHPQVIESLLPGLLRRWAEVNPADAWAYVQKVAVPGNRAPLEQAVLYGWGKRDLAAAIEMIRRQPNGLPKQRYIGALLAEVAGRDPAAALAVAAAWPVDAKTLQFTVLQRWAARDPAATVAALAAGPQKPPELLAIIAQCWLRRDPASAVAWMKSLPGLNPFGRDKEKVLAALALASPALSAQFLAGLPAGALRNECLRIMVAAMSGYDFHAAAAWLAGFPDGAGKRAAQLVLIRQWAEFDARAAIAYYASLPAGASQRTALEMITQLWAPAEPRAAAAWALGLPPKSRDASVPIVIAMWAREDPAAAAAWAASWPASQAQTNALLNIARTWVWGNSPAAAAWVAQFKDGDLKEKAACSLARDWARRDPEAAGRWIKGLPAGRTRDAALASLAETITQRFDVKEAIATAQTIEAPELRQSALESAASEWIIRDPYAARPWIEQSAWPDGIKSQLLKRTP